MESNALEKLTNHSVASRFFARKPSRIRPIVQICDIEDRFLRKPFWFFLSIFSILGSLENKGCYAYNVFLLYKHFFRICLSFFSTNVCLFTVLFSFLLLSFISFFLSLLFFFFLLLLLLFLSFFLDYCLSSSSFIVFSFSLTINLCFPFIFSSFSFLFSVNFFFFFFFLS